jgi:hypothetical protein
MAININIPSQVTEEIREGVTTTAPSEDTVFNALADKANSADLATVATTGDYNDLINQPSIPAAQVNSDWDATSGVAEILNKPTIPDVSGFVPYTGANADLDMGSYNVTADHMALNVSPSGSGYVVGATQWNNTIGSSETLLKGGNVSLKNGVDLVARIVNKVTPNTTLTKAAYQAVRVSGAQGGRLAVALAKADTDNNSADTIGLVTETINTNQEGFIITVGQLLDVNTTGSLQGETWADGDVLYLSPTTAGKITNIKPTGATGHIVVIGYVEYAHANNGAIYVKIMNGWELDELHNVYINPSTLADNNLLQYDSATSLWKNESLSTAGVQPTLTSGTNIKTINGTSLLGSGDITVGGGITVGTTAVTSGTIGRVFFQGTGNVVQQDAGLLFDSTSKTFTNYGKGAIATNTSFGLQVFENITTAFQNSAFGVRSLQKITTSSYNSSFGYEALMNHSTGDSNTAFGWNALKGSTSGISNTAIGVNAASTITTGYGNVVLGASSTTGITTGTFNTLIGCNITGLSTTLANNVILADGNGASGTALWKNSSNFVGIGYNPTSGTLGAKLDVRAQGALSTDIAFRVRNSADNLNNFQVNGNNSIYMLGDGDLGSIRLTRQTGHSTLLQHRSTNTLPSVFTISSFAQGGSEPQIKFDTVFADGSTPTFTIARLIFGLSDLTASSLWSPFGASTATAFTMKNSLGYIGYGTIPTGTPADHFAMYSADIVAGNAAPHFRTENGGIIKLYKETTAVAASTLVSNLGTPLTDTDTFDGYTLKQIVKALRNQGLLT